MRLSEDRSAGGDPEPPTGATGMVGGGFYRRHAAPQLAGALHGAVPLLTEAVGLVPGGPGPFVVADFGCADGANSYEPVRRVIDAVRAVRADRPVVVVHDDLGTNDFTSLFQGLRDSPDSYLRARSGVYPLAVAGSFYGPLLPRSSVSLAWSAHSVHWLSTAPDALGNHLYVDLADGEDRRPWTERARHDWRHFLGARARELVPGGQMVLQLAASDPDRAVTGPAPLYRLAEAALGSLVDRGELSAREATGIALPVYPRTAEELEEPFAGTPIGPLLELERLEPLRIPDPYLDAYRTTGDAGTYAAAWTATFRAFTERPFFSARSLPGRRPEERTRIADTFYAVMERSIGLDPMGATNEWFVHSVRIGRTGEPAGKGR